MKKISVCAFALIALVAPHVAAAQNGTPSTKATAAINTAVGCTVSKATTIGDPLPATCHDVFLGTSVPVTPDNFVPVMSATIKVSNSQSLFISPSMVSALYTQTKTKSGPGDGPSTAVAAGGVYLRAVIVNQNTGVVQVAYPLPACVPGILGCYQDGGGAWGVTLNTRVQSLTQEISQCVIDVVDFGDANDGTCDFDLTTDLILKTSSAHTFNFILPNVGQGVYTVQIQAAVNSAATVSGAGTAVGAAAYGLGSLTVESVRLTQGSNEFSF